MFLQLTDSVFYQLIVLIYHSYKWLLKTVTLFGIPLETLPFLVYK